MAQMFYRQGREDERNGVEEYDRLWKLNKKRTIVNVAQNARQSQGGDSGT